MNAMGSNIPDFYRLQGSSPQLGLEEGQARLDCPPGTVKVYLQEFPWEQCVPESELTEPVPFEIPEEIAPPEVPALPTPPPPEPEYKPPGKARFLEVDERTGEIVDPDTGAPLPIVTAFALTPVEGVVAGVGVLTVTVLLLTAFGVFGGK